MSTVGRRPPSLACFQAGKELGMLGRQLKRSLSINCHVSQLIQSRASSKRILKVDYSDALV